MTSPGARSPGQFRSDSSCCSLIAPNLARNPEWHRQFATRATVLCAFPAARPAVSEPCLPASLVPEPRCLGARYVDHRQRGPRLGAAVTFIFRHVLALGFLISPGPAPRPSL